jgi:LacI family transcriptional regulator
MAGGAQSRRPVQKDVAELAGVSRTTVSFVLNGVENIAIPEETRQRVLDAAAALGFRPNAMARGLRGGRSNVLGLLTSDIVTTPYAVEIIKGAEEAVFARGLTLLIIDTGGSQEAGKEAAERLAEWRVDGVIYATEYHRKCELPAPDLNSPIVLVNCFAGPERRSLPAIPTILPDEVQGGLTATQALLDAGHKRIGFINGPPEYAPAHTGRLTGYRQALELAGLAFDADMVRVGDWWQESGARHTADLLALPQPPTAVFCGNDWMAMGAYDAVKEAGLHIPGDIAVVGFDNRVEIADHMRPKLTTVALPYRQMGARAVDILLDPQLLAAAGTELITCPLVRRSSV